MGQILKQAVDFSHTVFGTHSRFHKAVFRGPVRFAEVEFKGVAEFLEVEFQQMAEFFTGEIFEWNGIFGICFSWTGGFFTEVKDQSGNLFSF